VKIKSQKDFWSGLMFIVTGIAFAWGALSYNFGSSARPGPAYFPFGLGVLQALLGALILFKALTIETEGGDPIGKWAWRPLLVVVAAVALFGLALPKLVIGSALAGDEFRWREAILNAVILTAASYGIFIMGLKLTIPVWPAFLN
jgi:Tripartite tricarboxylate transporter TctB family